MELRLTAGTSQILTRRHNEHDEGMSNYQSPMTRLRKVAPVVGIWSVSFFPIRRARRAVVVILSNYRLGTGGLLVGGWPGVARNGLGPRGLG